MKTKTCPDCGFIGEDIKDLFPISGTSTGRKCKPCRNKYQREHARLKRENRQDNPDHISVDGMDWMGNSNWLYV